MDKNYGNCPPEARNKLIPDFLGWAAARLCILPRYATDSDDGRTSTPDENQREREDQSYLRRDVFLCVPLVRLHIGGIRRVYVCAGVKTLRAVTGMKKERFALLDLGELVPQTFGL